MTADKEHIDLFGAELVASKEVDGVLFQLYSNRIFYVRIPRYETVGPKIIQQGYDFLDEHGGGKFHNIYHMQSFSDVDQHTRDWASDPEGNKYTHTDAIVIENVGQKIITDFYLKFDKPVVPTKVFFSLEKSIQWTLRQMK